LIINPQTSTPLVYFFDILLTSRTPIYLHKMMLKRPKTTPTFGPGGRRLKPICSSNRLFRPEHKIFVKRAPLMNGLSCRSSSLFKKFQRPMKKRRAYKKEADVALKQSSLGVRRSMDGMARLRERAGRGLTFKTKSRLPEKDGTASSSGEESEEEKEDRPFEPLMVWRSPHQGGECKGLPSRM
jgi:hypothetical protein